MVIIHHDHHRYYHHDHHYHYHHHIYHNQKSTCPMYHITDTFYNSYALHSAYLSVDLPCHAIEGPLLADSKAFPATRNEVIPIKSGGHRII